MVTGGSEPPLYLLQYEVRQLKEEGYLVPESVMEQLSMLTPEKDLWSEKVEEIYKLLEDLPMDPDWKYEEPDELDQIRALRPEGPRKLEMNLTEEELLAKFHSAWRGRSVGCALGKPVEGWPRKRIKERLLAIGEWELKDYISEKMQGIRCPKSQRENIQYMEADDDINYVFIGLLCMEQFGKDFQWDNIADTWNSRLPYKAIWTAETQAILNYNMRSAHLYGHCTTPAFTRHHCNPFREFIGASIRADFFGYAAAGNPELAAEFAYRDACWTHTKNGIYGEMFIAAIIAAAFVESDPVKLIETGLSEIPANCRLAEGVRLALQWKKECPSWEDFMDKLDEKYKDMHPVHTINNLLIEIMALLYGDTTIDRNTALAVMGGLDTDCTGATVGSITGILNPVSKLAERLNETIEPAVIGEQVCKMESLAKRTLEVWKKVNF